MLDDIAAAHLSYILQQAIDVGDCDRFLQAISFSIRKRQQTADYRASALARADIVAGAGSPVVR